MFMTPTAALLPFVRLNSFTSSRSVLHSVHTGRLHVHSCTIVFSSGSFCGRLTRVAYALHEAPRRRPVLSGESVGYGNGRLGKGTWCGLLKGEKPHKCIHDAVSSLKSPEFHIRGLTRVTSKGCSGFTWTVFNFETSILVSE